MTAGPIEITDPPVKEHLVATSGNTRCMRCARRVVLLCCDNCIIFLLVFVIVDFYIAPARLLAQNSLTQNKLLLLIILPSFGT